MLMKRRREAESSRLPLDSRRVRRNRDRPKQSGTTRDGGVRSGYSNVKRTLCAWKGLHQSILSIDHRQEGSVYGKEVTVDRCIDLLAD